MNGAVAKRLNLLRWKAVSNDEERPLRHRALAEAPGLIACLTGSIRLLHRAKARSEEASPQQAV
ncbi:MAG: hypothetical protein JO354_10225 [Verrucomicrobia bacterium]|nr:hypothetical protein [Verrucomicrobiota bacterium]